MAIRHEQALRYIERIKIILDRSPVMTKDLRDGAIQFDGFKLNMVDAFRVVGMLDELDEYLRRT